jgi:hypothetical protein
MNKTLSLIIWIIMLVFAICGCAAPSADTDSAASASAPSTPSESTVTANTNEESNLSGELSGNEYINDVLGFKATIPDEWVFASKEDIQQVSGQVSDIIKNVTDMESNSSVMLMMCSQYKFDPNGRANPNVNISFSNQTSIFQILTDSSAFDQFVDQLQSMYSEMYKQLSPDTIVRVSGEQRLQINDKDYAVARIETEFVSGIMYQEQYFTQVDKGALTITVTYYNETEKNVTDTFMQSIAYE